MESSRFFTVSANRVRVSFLFYGSCLKVLGSGIGLHLCMPAQGNYGLSFVGASRKFRALMIRMCVGLCGLGLWFRHDLVVLVLRGPLLTPAKVPLP